MDAEAVRPWWRRMSLRERIKWAGTMDHLLSRAANRLLREQIPIDDDVPLDPEAVHAGGVASRPEVSRWIKRLQRLSGDMPEGIFVVASDGGALNIYADPDGNYESSTAVPS